MPRILLAMDSDKSFGSNLAAAKRYAQEDSKNGYVQHVNEDTKGIYVVSDWYDYETTVASYENGHEK